MPSLRYVRDKYIKQWSTHYYKMEYGGYLSNHLLHGLTALSDLGASEAQIDAFADRYVAKLCVVTDRVKDEEAPAVSLQEAQALVGKRTDFEGLRALYTTEIQHITADGAVREHLPKIVDGLAGALLHGIIQLGYAYHVGGDSLVAEGLAYLHFSHLSFAAPDDEDESILIRDAAHDKKPITKDAMLTLARSVQKDQSLLEELYKEIQKPVLAGTTQGYLQRRLMAFSSDKERGDPVLFDAVKNVVDQFDFSEMDGRTGVDFAVWLFSIAPTNDFVLLHATTSAWSLAKVEHLLAVDDRVRAWKVWYRMALSAFIMHEIPQLPAEDPCEQAEQKLATLPSWEEILAKTLALEGDVDEHVYKLVQVAYDLAKRDIGTGSPDEEPGSNVTSKKDFLTPVQRDFVTRSAALKVISEPFSDLQLSHDV